MLLAPTLTERVILPAAWGGSYFFNRIGQKQWDGLPLASASECQTEGANHS